jgi:hypothetical protein
MLGDVETEFVVEDDWPGRQGIPSGIGEREL